MRYQAYQPAPDLRPYVKCYWMLRSDTNPFAEAEPLIPDGCIELIFNLDAPYRRFPVANANAKALIKGSHIVGERTRAFLVEQLGAIDHVAIRFRPGGLYPFTAAPISELTNRTLPADLILGNDTPLLEEQLFEASSDSSRVALLDRMLRCRLATSDSRQRLIHAAVQLLYRSHGNVSIHQLCEHLDCDYKQLERGFLTVVGLRPKTFGRLLRFLRAFDALKNVPAGDWLQVALDSGYYDHAHFTKEFKAFTGVAPSGFRTHPASITAMLTRSVDA